jgi:MSHA biogenesis protein MshE
MVGEMRDHETVEIGLRGALTGHLVLSTLHTNDAISSAIRLLDMGAPGYLVASSLKAIVAQRLIRKICDNCSIEHTPTDEHKIWLSRLDNHLGASSFKKGKGCQRCNFNGYRGRVGVFELLQLNEDMMRALKNDDTAGFTTAAQSSAGFRTLAQAALDYAKLGITTLDEVMRLVEMVQDAPAIDSPEPALDVATNANMSAVEENFELNTGLTGDVLGNNGAQSAGKPRIRPSNGGFSLEDID